MSLVKQGHKLHEAALSFSCATFPSLSLMSTPPQTPSSCFDSRGSSIGEHIKAASLETFSYFSFFRIQENCEENSFKKRVMEEEKWMENEFSMETSEGAADS